MGGVGREAGGRGADATTMLLLGVYKHGYAYPRSG